MIEFLIRAAGGNDWDLLEIHRDRLAEALVPAGIGAVPRPSDGNARFDLEECEVTVMAEDPGWHVVFDGSISVERATEVVSLIAASVERATGEPTRIVQIAGFDSA